MSAKQVGFFALHRQAIENLIPIAEAVRHAGATPIFVTADELFHQDTEPLVREAGFRAVPLVAERLAKPLPFHSAVERAMTLWKLRGRFAEVAALGSVWVACGDNAPQRALFEQTAPGVLRIVVADAVFGGPELEWSFVLGRPVADIIAHAKKRTRLRLLNAAIAARASWWLPGHSGHSGADLMVLGGAFNVGLVKRSGGSVGLYWPVGLPRYRALLERAAPPTLDTSRRLRIALLTSAFAWHGDAALQRLQDDTVGDIAAAMNREAAHYETHMKHHPREDGAFYGRLAAQNAGITFDHTVSAAAMTEWADVVITFMSSVALEALAVGKVAVLCGWGYDWTRMHGTPYADPAIPRPRSSAELLQLLSQLRVPATYSALAQRQRALRDNLFAPSTPDAASRVAEVASLGTTDAAAALNLARQYGAASIR